jgi:peptide/nickel transport system substrate-binding protein
LKKLSIFLVVFLLASASILLGCGTPAATTTAPAAPATPAALAAPATAAATASPATAAQYGGVLRVADSLPVMLPFGDPLKLWGPMYYRASISLEKLVLPGDKVGTFKYVLATGFEMAPDKSYYDISLRHGVKFHDGTDFSAAAVKWNLDRVKAAKGVELQAVSSIEAIDDYTVRLNITKWNNTILSDLTHTNCFIISPAAFEKNGADWANTNPVGTGAFKFKEIQNNQILVYERNADYWEKGLPYLDGVEIHSIQDPVVSKAALLAGEVDWLESVDIPTMNEFKTNSKYTLKVIDGEMGGCFCMNEVDPASPWHDVKVRQALEYALDKDAIAKVTSPYATGTYNIIKGLENNLTENIVPRKYDPARAKELLAAAGYKDGFTFKWYTEGAGMQGPFANQFLMVQDQLGKVGLKAEFELVERAKIVELSQGPMPGNSVRSETLPGNSLNPIEVVKQNLGADTGYFIGLDWPADWASLLEKAEQTTDQQESLRTLVKMDEEATANAITIPLINSPVVDVHIGTLQNIDIGRNGWVLNNAWFKK